MSSVLQLLLSLSALFFLLTFLLIFLIVYLRMFKNIRNEKKKHQENLLVEFITGYLFDENFDKTEIQKFKATHLRTALEKKMMIKDVLIYNQNFKGESSIAIRKLFFELELDKVVLRDLDRGKWFKVARAIYVLSQLGIQIKASRIGTLLNHRKDEVREQALLHFIKLAQDEPLEFFNKIEKPLTIWLQIYIGNALKYSYQGPIPDFSKWLDHKLTTVVEFSIKMIAEYNQFENIPKLLPFLDQPEEVLKKEAIKSLVKLGYDDAIEPLTRHFSTQPSEIKREIIKMIRELGSYSQLMEISPYINENDWAVKLEYLKVEQVLLSDN